MASRQQSGWDIVLHLFPTSVVDAMARGDILQVVVFSTFFGIALAAIGERGKPVLELLDCRRADHVQVHGLRDAVRADRRHGRHCRDGRRQGTGDSDHARQARGADVCRLCRSSC